MMWMESLLPFAIMEMVDLDPVDEEDASEMKEMIDQTL